MIFSDYSSLKIFIFFTFGKIPIQMKPKNVKKYIFLTIHQKKILFFFIFGKMPIQMKPKNDKKLFFSAALK